MKMKKARILLLIFSLVFIALACEKDLPVGEYPVLDTDRGPRPYHLQTPPGFPDFFLADENRLTHEGVELGRKLFFDPLLSRKKNVSCASCHLQENGFSDPRTKSVGTNNEETGFHSMAIFNIAWMNEFFWDGRAKSREDQALQPVTNPLEMDMTWPEVEERLQNHPEYPDLFEAAFGSREIDSMDVVKAMVQFEMTLVSSNSKFDRWWRNEYQLTPMESAGERIFNTEVGDCFHCHGSILTTDNEFHNNGLDSDEALRPGLFSTTNNLEDFGKFKTPTLRNLVFTEPYMHDGRFNTLREVIEFYSTGVHDNRTVDVNMKKAGIGGVNLTDQQIDELIAFLLTMTDSSFITDKRFSDPFE